jgi:4-amino-4-deoxy-L-arabinose transferase-like glycosyltransferase
MPVVAVPDVEVVDFEVTRRTLLLARFVVGALAALSFVISLAVAALLFPHQSVNNDEAVYVFQAKAMLQGELTLPAEAHRDFFKPWMSGEHDGRQVMVFQPVLPATLALSERLFGTMRIAPALIAAGCVLLVAAFTREAIGGEWTAVAAAALFAFSPLVVIQSGVYLGYLYAVLLELATLLLVLRGRRLGSATNLVAAGMTIGLLFFLRPLDAILLAVALGVYFAVRDRRDLRRAGRAIGWGTIGALPLFAICLGYNARVTGSPLRFPLWTIGGSNEFGFGTRSIVTDAPAMDITFRRSFWAMRGNLAAFWDWYTGGVIALGLAGYGLWRLRRDAVAALLAAIAVVVPLGYLFYWGNVLIVFGRVFLGPHYYLALLIPTTVLVAYGLVSLGQRRRPAVYIAAAALFVVTAIEFPDTIRHNHRASEIARAEHEVLRQTVVEPAVVLLPRSRDGAYVMHPRGSMMNRPDLTGPVLYAVDRSEQNIELFERFPDRNIYRLQQSEGPTADSPFRPTVRRLQRRDLDGPAKALLNAENTTGAPVAQLYATLGLERINCVIDQHSVTGRSYQQQLTVAADSVTLGCPDGPQRLTRSDSSATLAMGIAFGPNNDIASAQLYEYRYWSRSHGTKLTLIEPAEKWRRGTDATRRWRVTDDNPTIELTLT